MGKLSDDMQKLRDTILEMREKRAGMKQELQSELAHLRGEVHTMCEGFRTERADKKAELDDILSKSHESISRSVAETVAEAHSLLGEFREEFAEKSEQGKKKRFDFINNVKEGVYSTLSDAERKRAKENAEWQAKRDDFSNQRGEFRHKINNRLVELRQEVRSLQQGFAEEREENIKQYHQQAAKDSNVRAEYVQNITDSVSTLMEGFNTFRSELLNDLHGMRSIWNSTLDAGAEQDDYWQYESQSERNDDMGIESEFDTYEEATVKTSGNPAEVSIPDQPDQEPDDLTRITGIGIERQTQLYDAGITSYTQLANESTDSIRQKLGIGLGDKSLSLWIEQAKVFVG